MRLFGEIVLNGKRHYGTENFAICFDTEIFNLFFLQDNPYVAKEAISSSWYPSYCPDTPLLEIGRKAAEERAEAMKYQHVWQQQRAEGQANQCCDLPPLENVLKNKLEPPPLPKEYLPEPDPWPQKVQQQQWCSPMAKFQCQNDPKNQTDQDIMPVKENCPPPSPPPESTSDNNCCSDEIKKDKSKEQCESRPPNPDCERLQEVAALCDQKLGLCKKEEEPRRPTACDFARQPMDTGIPPGPPNDRLCEKFMSFAQGTQPKMQLYDPANREFVEKNFQGLADRCQTLQSECFQNWDKKEKEAEGCNDEEESKTKAYKCCNLEPVGCEDRVKEVPPGCCDYRKLEGLSEEFIPPGFDICCPPMPENGSSLRIALIYSLRRIVHDAL